MQPDPRFTDPEAMQEQSDLPAVSDYDSANPDCMACQGGGWVCENHSDHPWAGTADVEPCCGGAGAPCHCNPLSYYNPQTDARDPRGCAILALLLVGFWAAVAAGVWAAFQGNY